VSRLFHGLGAQRYYQQSVSHDQSRKD